VAIAHLVGVLMRFDPKAILVSLAAGGFILYAAERPQPVVIPVVRPTVTAGLPHTTANQLRVSVKPSTEEPSDLWSLKPLVRPPIPAGTAEFDEPDRCLCSVALCREESDFRRSCR
jgi:hypothetical protein